MQVSRVVCEGGRCTVYGDITTTGPADLVFLYTPNFVRSDGSRLVAEFDPPVDCNFGVSAEHGLAYLYCAPVLKEVELVEHDGEYYLEEVEE